MYTRSQLQAISGLNARQLRTRLDNLHIVPNKRGVYYPEHLQLITEYKIQSGNKIIILESKLNLKDYEI